MRIKAGKLYRWVVVALWLTLWGVSAQEPYDITFSTNAPISGFQLTNAFGGLRFDQPIGIVTAPGETNRLFVIERKGVIAVITNLANPTRSVFLDITDKTQSYYEELGLLGVAFHPGFATNGYFFVYRTGYNLRLRDELVRYQVSADNPNSADPSSELVLISQFDADEHHNGGGLAFGPDGYLYLAIGEGSPWKDNESEFRQNIDKGFFGCMLRLDVDKRPGSLPPNVGTGYSTNYAIPADNPWIGATEFEGRATDPNAVRTELYAIGLRQPFRLSFDSFTGDLYLGDVGQNTIEEINLIQKGGNYGWPFREGLNPLSDTDDFGFIPPVAFYHHAAESNSIGSAVIGGIVLRNGNLPLLEGSYVFGDFVSGNIWKLSRDGAETSVSWIARELGLSSFGRDPSNGSLLVANAGSGLIRRMVYHSSPESPMPARLSQTGLFSDVASLTPRPNLLPFDINVTFWSDNALKTRWFSLPDTNRMTFSEEGNWGFPAGTLWVKHFDLEMKKGDRSTAKRIETRVLIKTDDGIEGYTYRWGESTTDAMLVPTEGMDESFVIQDAEETRTQIWHYPARGECQSCHTANAGYALGFNTPQLNKTVSREGSSVNQLQWLASRSCLDRTNIDPNALRQLAPATDATQPIAHRVKSYFAANCAACHPNGSAFRMRWDPRITTPLSQSGIIDASPIIPLTTAPEEAIIRSQNPDVSVLYQRLAVFDPFLLHMPPIGTSELNQQALDLLREFIMGIGTNEWSKSQIAAESPLEGSAHHTTNSIVLGGAGRGIDDHFAYSTLLTNNAQIVTHIRSLIWGPAGFSAGLEMRGSTNSGGRGAWLLRQINKANQFVTRLSDNGETASQSSGARGASWQRLLRQQNRIIAFESADGAVWNQIGSATITNLPESLTAGIAVSSGNPWRYATIELDPPQTVSISLSASASTATLPANVSFTAAVVTNNAAIQRVEFLADGQLIGVANSAPWSLAWSDATVGSHDVTAVAIDQNNLSVPSAPVQLHILRKPTTAAFVNDSQNSGPIWANQFGAEGYALPALTTNWPGQMLFSMTAAGVATYPMSPLPGLSDLLGGLLKSAWNVPTFLSIDLTLPVEDPYKITFFFSPYDHPISQNITISDLVSSAQLATRHVQTEDAGLFVSAIARGPVRVRLDAQNQFGISLSGIFVDRLPSAQITLQAKTNKITLPGSLALSANASVDGRMIRTVQFWDNETLIGEDSEPPFEFLWTNAFAGVHQVRARVIDQLGVSADSAPVEITANLPAASATFVRIDSTTLGDWTTAYGSSGYFIPGLPPVFSKQTTWDIKGDVFVWAYETDDPSGLLRLDGASRYSAVDYYSWDAGLHANLVTLDGQPHQLALYFFDSPTIRRAVKIRIYDAYTQNLLIEKNTDPIQTGIYFVFNAQGPLHIELLPLDDWEPILGGLFLDGPLPPEAAWWMANFHEPLDSSSHWQADPDNDGRPNLLEYALGSDPNAVDPALSQYIQFDGENISIAVPLGVNLPDNCVFHLERSTDLLEWHALDGDQVSNQSGSLQFRVSASDTTLGFFRLRAEFVEP